MSVRVVARIRPLLKLELDKDTIVTAEAAGSEKPASPTVVRIPNPKNESESFTFQFNSVYEQQATQQDIFENEVAPTVKHLFKGFDTTIFAYGVTGTGKTHTMRGGKSLADRGVIPRLLSGIYRRCRKIEKDTSGATKAEVAMSYYEIYNDKVYDLFEAPEKRTPSGLPIRDHNGKTVVVGLTERPCTTLKEFEHLYDQANVNRSTSATKLNAHSSRSHAILCVKITQTTETSVRVSRASAIDLAGSEDNRRTDNNKERLVESSNINKSLFVLAQCVEAISKKQTRIPYRESKMTRILSLGQNNGLTVMILNLAPVRSYHLDTLSSLNFANRTKKIEVSEIENEPMFRGDTKPSITASIAGRNIQRQPLRPIASALNANISIGSIPGQKFEKPVKEFSVYADPKKPTRPSAGSTNAARRPNEPQKRRAEAHIQSRPSKVSKPTVSRPQPTEAALSAAAIEAMIDAKLSAKFAERALSDNTFSVPELPSDLQRRLDELEQRIEASTDKSKEGLHFLMMAKQHHARGEDVSALKMFQLAVPYFPSNERLEKKIAALQEKISEKKSGLHRKPEIVLSQTLPDPFEQSVNEPQVESMRIALDNRQNRIRRPLISKPKEEPLASKPLSKLWLQHHDENDDDADDLDGSNFLPDHDDNDEDASFSPAFVHPKRKTAPAKFKIPVFCGSTSSSDPLQHSPSKHQSHTPRTSRLLRIINSKDVSSIREFKGVGAKRAEAIVNCLLEMDGGEIRDLEELAGMKGVGRKVVEGMRAGLGELDL